MTLARLLDGFKLDTNLKLRNEGTETHYYLDIVIRVDRSGMIASKAIHYRKNLG